VTREQTLPLRRRAAGFALAAATLVGLTVLLVATSRPLSVASSLSLYLLALVAVTAIGGQWPGLATAVCAPLLVNWFLIPPYHTLRISDRDNLIELAVFVSVAVIVAWFVSVSARNEVAARVAARDVTTLARLSEAGLREPLGEIVSLLRETFGFDGVSVLREESYGYTVVASSGIRPPSSPEDAGFSDHLGQKFILVAHGPQPGDRERRILDAFLGQLAKSLEQERLRRVELEAEALARTDELRTAILRAVSHDLRSPLASIKASVSSLRQDDIDWPDDVEAEFLESIEDQTDRLTSIVMNLLDLSRIEAGVLRPSMDRVLLDDVVAAALRNIDADTSIVDVALGSDLPDAVADAALLERAIANLLTNAIAWSKRDSVVTRVRIETELTDREVRLHIIDHGPGIPGTMRKAVVQPFHRLTDSSVTGGLGLGLAIVDRLLAAMGGRLELHDTPGGGLTAVVALARSQASETRPGS
jgi:two-component system, OmpR family, sensor histidine kinase KdpD